MKEQEIQEKIEKLEYEKMGYLEANDKAGARRKQNKIDKLENQLELLKLKEIKEDLALYKKFVAKRGLNTEFQQFMIIELASR